MNMKQAGAISDLQRALEACRNSGMASWQVAMQVQNLLYDWANKEGFEVKVTTVKK